MTIPTVNQRSKETLYIVTGTYIHTQLHELPPGLPTLSNYVYHHSVSRALRTPFLTNIFFRKIQFNISNRSRILLIMQMGHL